MKTILLLACVSIPMWFGACRSAPPRPAADCDVCVYGATAAGVVAAVAAAQRGLSVVLIDCDGLVGGLTTSGLGATDVGNKDAIGGLSRQFYRRLRGPAGRGR